MSGAKRIEFLEREGYRQRRWRDGARLLPVFAIVMMFLPLLWPRDRPDQSLTSSGIIYLFGLWTLLVVVSFILSRVLQFGETARPEDEARKARGG